MSVVVGVAELVVVVVVVIVAGVDDSDCDLKDVGVCVVAADAVGADVEGVDRELFAMPGVVLMEELCDVIVSGGVIVVVGIDGVDVIAGSIADKVGYGCEGFACLASVEIAGVGTAAGSSQLQGLLVALAR